MDQDPEQPKPLSCGCILLAILPLVILLVFFILVILRTVAAGGM